MKIRRVNLLPNVITAFGLCCGLFAIFKTNMTGLGEMTKETLVMTTAILLLAALADLLDGAVARAMKVESEFGSFFDCIADAVTFGVAPSIIVLKSLSIPPKTEMSYLLTAAALIYSVCGVLRLVRFSVMSHQAEENETLKEAHKKNFTGLPIPAAAAALISSNLIFFSDELNGLFSMTADTQAWILFSIMILLGYLMISRWKFFSLKSLNIKVKSFQHVFFFVVFTVFVVFYGLLQHFSIVFATVAWGYVLIAWALSILRLLTGNKAPALKDFEPDSDELDESESPSEKK